MHVADSQSTGLIYLATSACSHELVSISTYDQILSSLLPMTIIEEQLSPIVASLSCFEIRGSRASTRKSFLGKASKKEVWLFPSFI